MANLRQAKTDDEVKKLTVNRVKDAYHDLAIDYNHLLDLDYIYCPHCGKWKTVKAFYSSTETASGIEHFACKECLIDMCTDKDKDGFNYGNRINSRDSRGSNCNSFNRYKNTSIIEKKQIATLKSELKAAKNEIDRVTKKMNDANGILITIGNAIIKLMNEIQMTNQIKEYFILIFRLLTFSEEKIARLFGEKEKNKKNNY